MQVQKIFLIDDDIDDQDIFIQALHSIDKTIQVSCAKDGQDALDKINEPGFIAPDLIFLDLNMPRVNGKQFLAAYKQFDSCKNVPVIIYSTSSQDTHMKETAALGASLFLVKPTKFSDLKTILAKLIIEDWNAMGNL